jgi:hypothetical protein
MGTLFQRACKLSISGQVHFKSGGKVGADGEIGPNG